VRYHERRIRPTPARPFAALGNRAWRTGLSEQVLPAEQQPVELDVGGLVLGGRPLAAVRTEIVKPLAGWIAVTLEVVGIFIIAMMALNALFIGVARALKQDGSERLFDQLRLRLGRGILLGLELLVAADMVHTVAVELSLTTVEVFWITVLIRTLLSIRLDVERIYRWASQKKA
jgi:uncharacterized membrane protein